MMSAFFYLQPTLFRLLNNCIKLMLNPFFLKYEGGQIDPTQEKLQWMLVFCFIIG